MDTDIIDEVARHYCDISVTEEVRRDHEEKEQLLHFVMQNGSSIEMPTFIVDEVRTKRHNMKPNKVVGIAGITFNIMRMLSDYID